MYPPIWDNRYEIVTHGRAHRRGLARLSLTPEENHSSDARTLARLAGVRDAGIGWRMKGDGPWFDNQVATLEIDGRDIRRRLEKAVPVDEQEARLECVLEQPLA